MIVVMVLVNIIVMVIMMLVIILTVMIIMMTIIILMMTIMGMEMITMIIVYGNCTSQAKGGRRGGGHFFTGGKIR